MNDLVQEGKNLHRKMKRKAVTVTANSTGNPLVESLCMDHSLWTGKVRKQRKHDKLSTPFALFDDLHEDYRDFGVFDSKRLTRGMERLAEQIEYLEKQEGGDSNDKKLYHFELSKNGLLSRTVDEKTNTYLIKQGSYRHEIILELSKSATKTFHSSKKLAAKLNITNKQVQRSIADLRKQIQNKFKGLKGEDFIEKGSSSLGYRLSPLVRITVE